MKLIAPITVAYSDITASNVALETAWVAGTYNADDIRRHADDDGNEWLWQCVAETTTTEEPSFTAVDWAAVGAPNQYAAFYGTTSFSGFRPSEVITKNAESVVWTITNASQITAFYFDGLVADTIEIVATETTTGDLLNEIYTLEDRTDYQFDYWRWFFLDAKPENTLTVMDINIPSGSEIQVTISNAGDTAECSNFAMGILEQYGTTQRGARSRTKTRSIKRATDITTELRRRVPSKVVSFTVFCERGTGRFLKEKLDELDGRLAVFIPEDARPELTSFAFTNDVDQELLEFNRSMTEIETETS